MGKGRRMIEGTLSKVKKKRKSIMTIQVPTLECKGGAREEVGGNREKVSTHDG